MTDIFLSYNREDQAVARLYAEAFIREGFEVWWDVTLRSGEAYDEVTEAALRGARAVVVLWSPRSVASRWVRAEATIADRNKTLVPATIEPCQRPVMFELTQTAELAHWTGNEADGAWRAFLSDVQRFVGASREAGASASAPAAAARAPGPGLRGVSVVVLPFANMSGDSEQDYFADGISEDIITDLGKVSALSVTSRNTAFTFKGKSVDVTQVASQLNVTHVLEGSVRKSGNRVRITAQLIDGSVGDQVWSERYDRDLDDIFALQDEISQAIVAALKLKLLPREKKAIEDRGTDSVEAYDFYLRAQDLARSFGTDEITRALDLYRHALAIDPNFMLAWHGLGVGLQRALLNAAGAPARVREEMAAVFERQLELDPDGWRTQLGLSRRHRTQFQWFEAEQAVERALASAPSEPTCHLAAAFFRQEMGRPREAFDLLRESVRLEPLSLEMSFVTLMSLLSAGELDAAELEYERSMPLSGDRGIVEFFIMLGLWNRETPERRKQRFERYLQFESIKLAVMRQLLEVFDQPEAARALVRDAYADPANRQATRHTILSFLACMFDDTETALLAARSSTLELKSVSSGHIWMPVFAKVRRDPRLKDLVRDLKMPEYWRASGQWGQFARPVGDDDFEIIG